MAKAKRGDRVHVHYTGTLEDGRVFDSSCNAGAQAYRNYRGEGVAFSPMELVVGAGEVLPAFEEAIIGLEPGQTVQVKIPCAEAYGPRVERNVAVVPRSDIAPRERILETWRLAENKQIVDAGPRVGDVIEVPSADGTPVPALVTDVTDATVTLDANHPLAGKDLTFEISLVDVVEAR